MRRKLLFIGDAACQSGFSLCTEKYMDTLVKHFDAEVLGINYFGDPHPNQHKYKIYPCYPGGDYMGIGRLVMLTKMMNPDVIIVQIDPWNIPSYLKKLGDGNVIGILPVDGKNCLGRGLNGLMLGVFWTKFGETEAKLGGYEGPSAVIPLGVDLDVYSPGDKIAARRQLFPAKLEDAFIVGTVGRNQPRKRLDLTLSFFADWIRRDKVEDAYLYLHSAPTGDVAYGLRQLSTYFGVANRVIITEPEMNQGAPIEIMPTIYRSLDMMFATPQGEGWGLPPMEAMACGTPCALPDWAAYGEWARPAARLIKGGEICVTPNKINAVGRVPDREDSIEALREIYRSPELRQEMAYAGLKLVAQPEFRWEHIGNRLVEEVDRALVEKGRTVALRTGALTRRTPEDAGSDQKGQGTVS